MMTRNHRALHFKRKQFAPGTITGALFSVLVAVVISAFLSSPPAVSASNPTVWSLVFSDEFNGPNGSPVDSSKWSFDTGTGCPTNFGGVTTNLRPIPVGLQTRIRKADSWLSKRSRKLSLGPTAKL